MAMFQFSARQVELNFCDQIKCVVPLTDEVQKKVQDAAKNCFACLRPRRTPTIRSIRSTTFAIL